MLRISAVFPYKITNTKEKNSHEHLQRPQKPSKAETNSAERSYLGVAPSGEKHYHME